jgi:hypothetical protein
MKVITGRRTCCAMCLSVLVLCLSIATVFRTLADGTSENGRRIVSFEISLDAANDMRSLMSEESLGSTALIRETEAGIVTVTMSADTAESLVLQVLLKEEWPEDELGRPPRFLVALFDVLTKARNENANGQAGAVAVTVTEDVAHLIIDAARDAGVEVERGPGDDPWMVLRIPETRVFSLMLQMADVVRAGDGDESHRAAVESLASAAREANLDPQEDPEMQARILRRVVEETRRSHVAITAAGVVVDEQDQPMQGVSARASKVMSIPLRWNNGTRSELIEQAVVDGAFRFAAEGARSLVIRFEKPGFHPEIVNIRPDTDALRQGIAYQRDNLRVVMQPIGEPAHLVRHRGALRFDASGRGVVFDLSHSINADPPRSQILPQQFGITVDPEEAKDRERLIEAIPHGISMTAMLTEDGEIATKEYVRPAGDPSVGPSRIVLQSHHPIGGFIPHAASRPEDRQRTWRAMREAPKDDYQTTWELTAEDLESIQHFFFRSGEYYGKGVITNSFYDPRHSRVLIDVVLHLNPRPNDRNVTTRN